VKYWKPLITHGHLPKIGARRLTAGLISLTAVTAFLTTVVPAPAGAATIAVGAAAPLPQGAVRLGTLSSSTVLRVDVVLAPRDPAALTRFATEVSTPGSPLYRDYLPAGAFPARFGPTAATIATVRSTLRARGLRPGAISANHLSIPVTATAGQLQSAFATSLARYRLPGGRTGFANATAPVLPAAAAAHVQAVIGLDSLIQAQPLLTGPSVPVAGGGRTTRSPDVVTGGPQPCAAATNIANSNPPFFGLTADQLAFAYKFSGLYHAKDFGRGVTVGIVEFGEPNLTSDITVFQKCYGLHNKVTYRPVDRFRRTGPGVGEAALDIETVSVMAPGASVLVYRAPNTGTGQFDAYSTVDSQDRARVVSVSFGLCEKFVPVSFGRALNVLFEQAAAQGQTVAAASGDRGSEGCLQVDGKPNELSANFPASDPFVLGVGGTSIVSNSPVTSPAFQVVWNDAFDGNGAAGGGRSTLFKMPQYQKSFLKVKSGVREEPDVSADADPETGYVIFHQGQWLVVGGTSAATPLWAGLLALTDAQCPAKRVGFVNPTLYHVSSAADPVPVMNDIVANSNFPGNVNNDFTGGGGGHYAVRAGYDMATGIGVPLGAPLAGQLCKFSPRK
jgi:subtilase family serine protease